MAGQTDSGNSPAEDDDLLDDDFYGNEASSIGTASGNDTTNVAAPAPIAPVTSNQLRAQELRAKLIAKRQSTPIKSSSRAATPSALATTGSAARTTTTAPIQKLPEYSRVEGSFREKRFLPASQDEERDNVAALIAEGEALAAAEAGRESSSTHTPINRQAYAGKTLEDLLGGSSSSANATPSRSIEVPPRDERTTTGPTHPTDLTDSYYDDLSAWLELTNYHDVATRKALLQPFLEQRELEEEAARIAERIAKLNRVQQESAQTFRFGTPTAGRASVPPPLPTSLPRSNGLKRERSPEPSSSSVGKSSRRDVGSQHARNNH
ncbi:uncharacterized protein K489DRAFT_380877 [Dissoconium aciculare CBS 342.82]|uniref:Uncharacterized protein n=1 Tax=Dissoconium aciculare CBS 342.82 TaxID=1314786 RepID=A0A6J3M3T0_9PEZI|nr:uncharacterized protein K489DRAFT_380877 [Dissoconium aciculare CBS 342.82]KAF1822134.1 hypothetical protein K489DRAFT_380877 [Dissoconium aciculare CBS 342.82]